MQLETLLAAKTENDYHYELFKAGEETALTYVYRHVQPALLRHGLRIVNDRFVAENLVHEAILKCWRFREQMESMRHIYCFMRQSLRWSCFSYYKKPVNHFHRAMMYSSREEDLTETAENYEQGLARAEQIKLLEEAMPYLPAKRRSMLQLYLRHGMNYTGIAGRFNASHQSVHRELQQSIVLLKKIIHATSQLEQPAHNFTQGVLQRDTSGMSAELKEIFRLRYEEKQGFASIASKMNLPQAYVQQQYIKAQQQLTASKTKQHGKNRYHHSNA